MHAVNMATALLDEWTEEKCLQLIRAYRARPILWDQKDPLYFKKNLKPRAWKEIGDVVNINPDQCKHKMIILMSSFRREKAKIVHGIKNSTGETPTDVSHQTYKSTWFAFKEMSFLLDKESERKRQLNADSEEIEENDEDSTTLKYTLLNHHSDPLHFNPSTKRPRLRIPHTIEYTHKVAHTEREEPEVPQIQPTPGPSQTTQERDEEIKSFTSFIGNKMKKYSDMTKNAVQQAICDIIFKADQNYYENTSCYEKFTIIDDVVDKHILEDGTVIKIQNASDSE